MKRPNTLCFAWMIAMGLTGEPYTFSDTVDRLLNSLEVHLHGLTVCSVAHGTHAKFGSVDAITVHYILAGEGGLQTGDDQIHPFRPLSVVIAPARVSQSWGSGNLGATVPGEAQCGPVDEKWMRLLSTDHSDAHLRVLRSEITVTNAGVPGFFDHLRAPILEDLTGHTTARQIFELLVNELARPGAGSREVAAGLMKAFLILMLRPHLDRRAHECNPSFAMMSDPQLARAMIHILERPEQPHTVDTLATAAGMSRTVFLERFKEAFSQSPIEFLQEFRLKFAAHLLRTTDLPIKSVAVAIGYSSRSYFSRAFKASYGMDPTAYRVDIRIGRPSPRKPLLEAEGV